MPKIYLIVGSYYGGERLQRLLKYLRSTKFPDFAILINEQLGDTRTVTGFAAIYNPLIDAAFADPNCNLVWLVSDDVTPEEGTIERTTVFMEADSTIGAVFPTETWCDGGDIVSISPFTSQQFKVTEWPDEPESIERIFAGFALVGIRREAWKLVGPMDTRIGNGYGEDLDWGIRCWKAGFRCVNYRRAAFLHIRGATYRQLIQDGLFAAQAPYDAAKEAQGKWPFLWRETDEQILTRLHDWYDEARKQ